MPTHVPGARIMIEDIEGNPIPCDHPIRWFHRLAAWVHRRIEGKTCIEQFEAAHTALPDWVCEAYERIEFGFPCRQCEDDRYREAKVIYPDDDSMIARFRPPSWSNLYEQEWPSEDEA